MSFLFVFFCFRLLMFSPNSRKTVAWHRQVFACVANWSWTVRESFGHVQKIYATKFLAGQSPSHRMCREPVANPSQTFAGTLHVIFRDPQNATNIMQYKCDISRRNCNKITLSDTRTTVARLLFILLHICRDHNVQWDCNYEIVENLRYITELCLRLVANLSHPSEILAYLVTCINHICLSDLVDHTEHNQKR